jgi:hypothetical protein
MTEKPVEVVKGPIDGLVAAIVSERELAINIGANRGVTRGMKFKVMSDVATEIKDPQTGETLGTVSRDKVHVEARSVSEKFSICRTYRTYRTGSAFNAGLAQLFEPSRKVTETLRAEDSSYISELSEEESFVEVGDRVEQVLEDSLTIGEVETTLENAALRGMLNSSAVEKAVTRWLQAEAELERVQKAEHGRDELIETALEEFNNSTQEITSLYNKAIG